MNSEDSAVLEHRLEELATELEYMKAELHHLQRRPAWLQRAGRFIAFLAVVVVVGEVTHVRGQGPEKEIARPTTVLEAPVEVRGKGGKLIARFSDNKGKYGLEVFGPSAEHVLIGANDLGGAVYMWNGSNNMVASIGGHGVAIFENSRAIAAMGKDDEKRGIVAVYNKAGHAVGFMLAGDSGNLTIADPLGEGVFSAGGTKDGGNACVSTRKRGVQCLGIGMPLSLK